MPLSLEAKIVTNWLCALLVAVGVFALTSLQNWPLPLNLALSTLLSLLIGLWLIRRVTKPLNRSLEALENGLLNFIDNDFSISLAINRRDEVGKLAEKYNQVSETLRRERQQLYQRELLLDTVLQSSPMAMLITDTSQRIIYANHEARHLLHRGVAMQGLTLDAVLQHCHPAIAELLHSGRDGLFTVEFGAKDYENPTHTYHLSQRQFTLNTQQHQLYLFKQLTREINRREVDIWKKVIRLINHELNNSLAPISSMAHSGKCLISDNEKQPKLVKVFATIAERCQHLTDFIQGYARFAKLPNPNLQHIDWAEFVGKLQLQTTFTLRQPLTGKPGWGDAAQLEQVLINLFKNAHEAGSKTEEIKLSISTVPSGTQIIVFDRGTGMSDAELDQALLPFYSTKNEGTGLGLALCREIVDAHEGSISLHNRANGGLKVSIYLPCANP